MWLRLSLVEICTVRRSSRQACSISTVSGIARTKLPPRLTKPCTLRARMPSQASTVFMPLSRGASSGFSVMPTVRWPCTFEWPRTGQMPAPGLPIAAHEQEVADHLDILHAVAVLRQAHAVDADHRTRLDVDGGGRFEVGAPQAGRAFDLLPAAGAHRS